MIYLLQRGFDVGYRKGFVVSFVFGFLVRLVPEILSFPHPIGFDTVYYAARMKSGVVWYNWTSVFSTWLLYAVLIPAYQTVKVDPFLLLKLVAPALYALNVGGVYFFASKALNWEARKALIAAFFFNFQLAALGISWHFYRNMLGLAMLLFALPLIGYMKTKTAFGLFVLFSLFAVFGHEYASVTLFAVILGLVVNRWLKRRGMVSWKVLAALIPALVVFLASVYLRMFPVSFHVDTNMIRVHDTFQHSPGGLFFLVDYLSVANPIESYPTYLHLVSHVFSLFALLYLIWVPLVLVGFFRNKILDGWITLLLVGSFGCLVVPFCALFLWHRWMLMLVYPFTFYAVNGFWRVLKSGPCVSGLKWLSWMKISRRSAVGISLVTVLLGSLFMTWPLISGRYGLFGASTTWKYFPSTMQSSSVPLQDIDGTVKAIEWLNWHMTNDSSALIHDAFNFWAMLHLDKNHTVFLFTRNIEEAIDVALENGFSSVYFIWWNENIGWYGFTVPSDFVSVFDSGRISVYQIS